VGWEAGLRTALAAVTGVVLALVFAGPADAKGTKPPPPSGTSGTTTLYVGGAGCSDAGTGTSTTPYCTIGAAAAVAVGGQTVLVGAGTYPENVTPKNSGQPSAPIVFTAAAGAAVRVTGQAHGFTISSQHDITVNGFTVSNTTSNGIYLKSSSRISVTGNIVTASGKRVSGQTATGIYVNATTGSTISGNTSYDNSDAGIFLTGGSTGIQVLGNQTYLNARGYVRAAPGIDVRSPGNQVIGNISHDNEDSGIQFYTGGDNNLAADNVVYHNKGWSTTLGAVVGDHGIDNLGVRGNRIISNSIYDNVTAGINVEGLPASWLTGAISSDATTLSVGTTTGFPATGAFTIQVDDEQMSVTAGQGSTTWTVQRGVNGTVPAAHMAGSSTTQNVLQWSGFVIENNVLMDNAVNCPTASGGVTTCPATKGNIRVDKTSFVGVTVDYDLMNLSVPGTWGTWQNTLYSSFNAFAAASGQEAHGLAGDPKWVDAGHGDLHVRRGSGAVDSANSGVSGEQTSDRDGKPCTDDLLTANTGTGPLAYCDRGAYEYQPNYPPNAVLSVSPASGTAPVAVVADASASTDTDSTPIASYSFNFGDGSPVVGPQSSPTAGHTYTLGGTFTVTVTVTDTAGESSTATTSVAVTASAQAPNAALTLSPGSGVAPLDVTADASGSSDPNGGQIVSYRFDFGDGSAAVGPQASPTAVHTYGAGTWTATVTVTNSQGLSGSATQAITVTAPPTNLVGNPGFETGTAGWNTSGRAGITLTTTGNGHTGSLAAQLANGGTVTQPDCTLNDAPNWVASAQAGSYLASAWVRGPVGATVQLRLREYNGSTFVGSRAVTATLTANWTQLSVTYPVGVVGSTIDLTLYTTNAAPGWCFDADDLWISHF
jgi:parallel beta-helix repeat protein